VKLNNKFICIFCGAFFLVLTLIMGENILFCLVTGVVCGILSYVIMKVSEQRKIRMRNRSYEMDLPDFMTHVAMFTQAGLGIYDAMERAVGVGDKNKQLYEDFNQVFVKIRKGATKDFITGLEELAALRKSAVLSDFCVTVIQNMRKGSGELSGLFTTQAQLYRNERRRLAGKLADEAATLLLIPSTLVLIALIVMLLAPALMEIFNGFQ